MEYTLIRSKRKSVALEIAPDGTLILRAPLYFTDKDAVDFIKKNEKWIFDHLPAILAKNQVVTSLSDNDILLAKKGAELLCSFLVKKYAPLMDVYPESIKITSAKKRFGSCSGKNGICFSYYLMLYPIEAITYVVVHELAHIRHHDHSRSFHQYIKRFLPEAEEYEKMLHPSCAKYENLYKNLELINSNQQYLSKKSK